MTASNPLQHGTTRLCRVPNPLVIIARWFFPGGKMGLTCFVFVSKIHTHSHTQRLSSVAAVGKAGGIASHGVYL